MQKKATHSEKLWDYWTTLPSQREKATLSLYTDWVNNARPKQLSPKEAHHIWLILAGRGWGKTRTGAQDIALYALRNPDSLCAVIAPTFGDLKRVCFGGPSGLLSIIPDDPEPTIGWSKLPTHIMR